jgi:hypothetical protein
MLKRWWFRPFRRRAPRKSAARFAPPLCLDELEPRNLLSGSSLSSAILLGLPGSASGFLSLAPEFYKVSVTEAGRLTASVQPGDPHADGFHARLSLLDTSGHVLVQSDGQSPTNPNDLIDLHVTGAATGTTYYLEVQGLGGGAGTFSLTTTFAATTEPWKPLPVGIEPWGAATGDFNGDGHTDLVTANFTGGNVTVYLGQGDGTFSAPRQYAIGSGADEVITGDFNHDGKLDIATANFNDSTISVLMGRGDGTFAPAATYYAGANAAALVAGDFYGDGKLDLAVADFGSNSVSILRNNGDGTFAAPVSYAVGSGPYWVTVGDFYGDGHLDLATANYNANTVSILRGRGDGTFTAGTTLAVGQSPYVVTAADLTGNGKLDLVTANFGANDVSVLVGNGDGTFRAETRLAAGSEPSGVTVADLNGDGHPDLVVPNNGDGTLSIFVGRGDGTFAPQQRLTVGTAPTWAAAADFNGDGRLDLAVTDSATSTVQVLLGRGDGTFQMQPPQSPGVQLQQVVSGDFNGDGRGDLAALDYNEHKDITIFQGQGDGTFRPGGKFSAGSDAVAIAVGDVNHDGIPDLVTANLSTGNISVLLGNGDGTFGAPTFFPAGTAPNSILLADLNGDGNLDVVEADNTTNQVTVLFGDGKGGFGAPVNYEVGQAPWAVTAIDVNHDGFPDLAVADAGSNDVEILINQGDGTFVAGPRLPAGAAPKSIVSGEFTRSGNLDLAVGNSGTGSVSVFLGDGHGGFASPITVVTGGSPSGLLTEDFNHDGKPDLAVIDQATNSVRVLAGNGDGTFAPLAPVPVGQAPLGGVVGDFNGDGLPDIATADSVSSDIGVLLGTAGGFRPVRKVPVGSGRVAVASADLNDDGQADLVTANYVGGTVCVRLGNGDGTFANPVTYAVGNGPDAVAIADFNGDGRPDLAVANFLDGTVSVLLGLGDGTFQPQQVYSVGKGPDAIAVGTFTGDGLPDLAAANYGSGTVTILPGRRDGTFGAPITVRVGAGPDSLAVADVDGDGRPDLVVGDYLSHDVTVVLDNGHGNFSAQTPVVLPAGPASVVAGDFNGDGVVDVAAACPAAGGIFLLPGQQILATGRAGYALQGPQLIATAAAPVALAAGDFNNDGRPDLAYADNNANVARVLLARGNGTFQAQAPYCVGPSPFGLVAADFNNDGHLDLATANGLGEPVSVAMGLGDGTFATAAVASPPVRSAPIVANMNGDGVPDIVVLRQDGKILFRPGLPGQPGAFGAPLVINPDPDWAARHITAGRAQDGRYVMLALSAKTNTSALYAYIGGQFVRVGVYDIPSALPSSFVTGDVNGDGIRDLVMASAATGEIDIALQRPNDNLANRPWDYQLHVSPGISSISLADLNGNGLPDVVVTNQVTGEVDVLVNSPDPATAFSTQLHFRAGTGLADLASDNGSELLQSDDVPVALVAGLFDGGAIPTLAVLNRGADRVDFLVPDGQGGLFNPDPAASLLTGHDPVAIVTGDFDGDGTPDLAVLNKGSGDISVFLGDGQGHFTEKLAVGPDGKPVCVSAGNAPTGLSVADLNGDGKLDLLVSNAQGDVLALYGNGDGTFRPYVRVARHVGLAVKDDQADGRPEFILADQAHDRVTVQYNDPGLSFLQGRTDGILSPNAVKLADLNGDGLPDLIVANGGGNDVLVYPGLPGGGFGPAQTFSTGTNPVGITVADLNGDGIPDLVVANEGSNDITILYGQGRGASWTLTPGPRLAAGEGPVATVVNDADHDDVPDIFVANSGSNNVYQLRAVGGGFFDDDHPIVFPTGIDPEALFVGNFDGRLDLVTLNAGSNDLTLFSGLGPGRSISSGGLDPAAAVMGDFMGNGFDDLIVANADGRFTLLAGGSDGLQALTTLRRPDLGSPSDIALGSVGTGGVSIYVATEGQESVAGLTFALDLSPVLPTGGGESVAILPQAAEFSSVADTALGTVATLVVGAAEPPPGGDAVASLAAPDATGASFVGPAAAPAGVVGAFLDVVAPDGPSASPALSPGAAHEAGLAAFLLGLDDLPFERRLGGQEPAAEGTAEPSLWDWLGAGETSSSPRPGTEAGREPTTRGAADRVLKNESPRPSDGAENLMPDPAADWKTAPAAGEGVGGDLIPLSQALPVEDSAEGSAVERPPAAALALCIVSGLGLATAGPDKGRKR